ncbi:MAG: hypothetical protein P4L57_06675 [Rhizomicrobium sp.]|nr:hypothetical protein [Rhizomicrobium sp.]
MRAKFLASVFLGGIFLLNQASAADLPWAVSLYVGPYSQKYFGAVLQDFNLQSRNVVVGVALDRKLIRLGYDIYVAGELQVTQTFAGHSDTTGAVELGLEFDKLFGYERTSFAVYTGPSYALNPDYYSVGYKHRTYASSRTKFLNAVSLEFASGLPFSQNWDWTARLYHRSGVFGLYSIGDDDGLAVGLGLKYHF